jgi:hypothetical protein
VKARGLEKENSIRNGLAISFPPNMLYKWRTSHFSFSRPYRYGDNIEGRIVKIAFTRPTIREMEVMP